MLVIFKFHGVFWLFFNFGGISVIFQKFRIYVFYLNFRWVLVGLSIKTHIIKEPNGFLPI